MTDERIAKLSRGEREVLTYMVEGLRLKEISKRRGVSATTIATIAHRAAKKLGARNANHAAVIFAQYMVVGELEYRSWGAA